MNHKILKYHLIFLTDAFLGGTKIGSDKPRASAEWRTPPFKALLRQWWRVVYAESKGFQVQGMFAEEQNLFGGIVGGDAQQSRIRIRLDTWGKKGIGKGNRIISLRKTPISEYSILCGGKAQLSILAPTENLEQLQKTLALMHAFATVGRGSRHGYGSFALEPVSSVEEETEPLLSNLFLQGYPWQDALQRFSWPQTIARDDKGLLVWKTVHPKKKPDDVLKKLFELRDKFKRYQITRQSQEQRLPNSFRFKVRQSQKESCYDGVIFHMPWKNTTAENWAEIYRIMDENESFARLLPKT